ncbi:MAG: Two-component sensor histidine kinase [Candidatus Saccharibacteria bacterium]|nr:Two-component sensor histidine kinase [Candidatus Saccharibacteria bacterium]
MNEFKKATIRLTINYSIVFFGFIWLFSGGIYLWTNDALGKGYVDHINELVEQSNSENNKELSDDTATVAADVALDRMRDIIIGINSIALLLIPTLAYLLSKHSLKPLIKSQEQQQQFISNASHELRTPLAVMAGELELALKKQRTVAQYRDTITNTNREVERMTSLVRELLLLTHIGSNEKLQNIITVESNHLIDEITSMYQQIITKKKIALIIEATNLQLRGNRDLLIIALGNILDNAIKFSPNKSSVKLTVRKKGNMVEFSFTNTGETIPAEKVTRLFERFYQTDIHHSAHGYGLGLAITKQIVELHGGNIAISSHENRTNARVCIPSL